MSLFRAQSALLRERRDGVQTEIDKARARFAAAALGDAINGDGAAQHAMLELREAEDRLRVLDAAIAAAEEGERGSAAKREQRARDQRFRSHVQHGGHINRAARDFEAASRDLLKAWTALTDAASRARSSVEGVGLDTYDVLMLSDQELCRVCERHLFKVGSKPGPVGDVPWLPGSAAAQILSGEYPAVIKSITAEVAERVAFVSARYKSALGIVPHGREADAPDSAAETPASDVNGTAGHVDTSAGKAAPAASVDGLPPARPVSYEVIEFVPPVAENIVEPAAAPAGPFSWAAAAKRGGTARRNPKVTS